MTERQTKIDKAKQTLELLRSSQFKIEFTAALLYWFSILIVLILAACMFEMALRAPSSLRYVTVASSIFIALSALIVLIVRLRLDPRLTNSLDSEEWWALALGSIAPEAIRDRLLNALQINRNSGTPRDQFSNALARHALYEVVYDLKDVDPLATLNFNNRKVALRVTIGVCTALVLALIITPAEMINALDRLVHPGKTYVITAAYSIDVSPRGGWAYRGEAKKFQILIDGKSPRKVEFLYQYTGGNQQKELILIENGSGTVSFESITESMTYHAKWKDVSSPVYHLSVISRPQIAELQYRLIPPRYSRLPTETGKENVGDVEALPGSRFEVKLRASKRLSAGWLIFLETGADSSELDSLALSIKGQTATVSFTLMREGKYNIRIRDRDNHPDKDPVTYNVSLVEDDAPAIQIVYPDTDVELGDNTILPLVLQADDDYGIRKIELAFKQLEVDSLAQKLEIELENPGAESQNVDYYWDIGDMFLMPGDVVEYWVIATDNDNINGPKSAGSGHQLVRLPSMEEILAGVEEAEEHSFDQVENSLEAAEELREAMNEILEEMKRNPEVDWERKRQIEEAVENQKQLQKQIEKLAQSINDLVERLEKHDLMTPETLEKYRQLQELIAEIATPEMKEAMEKLQAALENQDPDDIRKALEEFDFDRESFLQNIEKTMNILKQLQLERRLDELVKQVEEILQRQEEVISKIDDSDLKELAGEQSELAGAMDVFEKSLQGAIQMSLENNEGALAKQLESIDSLATKRAIRENMQTTSSNMDAGQKKTSRKGAEQSARDLSDIASRLAKSAEDLKQRRKDELARKIRRLAEELLYLSEDQEDLAGQSSELGTQSPRYRDLAGTQGSIRNSLNGVIERLFEIGKKTFFITPALGASLGKASQELGKSLDKYTSRSPRSAATSQKKALGEINRSIMQLINILDQLQSASSSSGYEEMLEKLSQMASSQQGLNQQSTPVPGPEGSQTMPGGEQMSRMAAQQRALRSQMEQLSEEGQGMREILGDLEGIAKSMGEIADDLDENNVNARTRRLQKQIVSRLLDATRSARQKEYSRKRESKAGKNLTRRSPAKLELDSDAEKLRRDLKRALQEGYTRDYRRLIRAYFQALEDVEKGKSQLSPTTQ